MPKRIRLAMEGGGGKGLALVGAMRALDELQAEVVELSGTSAGAITASLLAAGYTTAELNEMSSPDGVLAVDWNRFLDRGTAPRVVFWGTVATAIVGLCVEIGDKIGAISTNLGWLETPRGIAVGLASVLGAGVVAWIGVFVKRIHWDGGIFLGDEFEAWLRERLRSKLKLDRDVRFSDLAVPLTVVASDVRNHRVIKFSRKTTPDFPVHKAVRASMSLPLVFVPVRTGFSYPGKPEYDSLLLDGGILSNLPLDAFADARGRVPKDAFGLLLDEGPPTRTWLHRVAPTIAMLRDSVDLSRSYHDSTTQEMYGNQVIRLPVAGYPTTKFQADRAEFLRLTSDAHAAVKAHKGLGDFLAKA